MLIQKDISIQKSQSFQSQMKVENILKLIYKMFNKTVRTDFKDFQSCLTYNNK